MEQIEKVRVEQKFNSLEKLRDLLVITDSWDQLGLLTTTMKKKRHAMEKHYKAQIEEMYQNLD